MYYYIHYRYIDRYLKSRDLKNTVHVIKHVNSLTKLFEETENWRQVYKQTNSTFYSPNETCLINKY